MSKTLTWSNRGVFEHSGGKIGGGGGHCNKHIQLYVVAQKGYQFELCCTSMHMLHNLELVPMYLCTTCLKDIWQISNICTCLIASLDCTT